MLSVSLLSVVALLATSISGQRTGQDGAEDPRGVQIIKQINRVNEDGTYTYGYEAADGSFKIETRDVLGNVKGMFGYVDQNGELKRVSYSAANGTGFQAVDDYGPPSPPLDLTTRRPILIYRGTTPNQIQKIPPRRRVSTTPAYEYGSRRPQVQDFEGDVTEAPQNHRHPARIIVTKRPLGPYSVESREQESVDRNNVRRQLGARDSQDIGGARVLPIPRGYNPQIERPDQREVYRNMLLEQNNLKPDYPSVQPRHRYYPAEEEEDMEYPDVPAVVPMVNRVLGASPNSRAPRPRYVRPPPSIVDENSYPIPPPSLVGRRLPYRGGLGGGYSRVPAPYDPYGPIDYEALREEIMNYLLQYVQFRTRGYNRPPPYALGGAGGYGDPLRGAGGYGDPLRGAGGYGDPLRGAGGYADPLRGAGGYADPLRGAGGYADPLRGAGGYADSGIDGYYQPRVPPYRQQDYYNQRLYGGRLGGFAGGLPGGSALPPPGAPPTVATPVAPTPPPPLPTIGRPVLPPYGGPASYGSPIAAGGYGPGGYGPQIGSGGYGPQIGPGGYGPQIGPGGYAPPVGPAASYPFVNPNVQYSSSEDASGTTTASSTTQTQSAQASESLTSFKERMDASDHRDASDVRPPAHNGLIKLLLARPGGARSQLLRPTVRSVEILGTAASENRATSSTTPRPFSLVSSTTARLVSTTTTTEADPMIAAA